jgi:hypothetical protein
MVRSSAALGSMAEALHILLPQWNENFGMFLGHPHIGLLFFWLRRICSLVYKLSAATFAGS